MARLLLSFIFLASAALAEPPRSVYAWPGTRDEQKGYTEPGGAFSPVANSFVLSIEGEDRLPLSYVRNTVRQRFAWVTGEPMPVVVTETPKFESHLLCDRPGHWTDLIFRHDAAPLHVAFASAGPLKNVQGRLQINERWLVRFDPPPTAVRLSDGQGRHRAEIVLATKATIEIVDTGFGGIGTLPFAVVRARVKAFDPQRQEALDAEVARLMMSLGGREASQLDPGAGITVTLARSGQVDIAKRLALNFADHDFFDANGADSSSLALWAIVETAAHAHSPDFDARVWNAVEQKARRVAARHDRTTADQEALNGAAALAARRGRSDLAAAWRKDPSDNDPAHSR